MRTRKTARPSNLPGKCRGREIKIGPCAKCGTKGHLIIGLCRRCYKHERYLARPGVAERIAKRKAQGQPELKSWVEDWLRQQVKNYLRENASHFDRNGTRLWAMTEEQVVGLCWIIYMAVDRHRGIKGEGPRTDYAHRQKEGEERTGRGSPGEWDKYEDFVDHRISSSFRRGFSRTRVD